MLKRFDEERSNESGKKDGHLTIMKEEGRTKAGETGERVKLLEELQRSLQQERRRVGVREILPPEGRKENQNISINLEFITPHRMYFVQNHVIEGLRGLAICVT